MTDPLRLIPADWIRKYGLADKEYEILEVPAADLLSPFRFDLFAKLFYARHRKDKPGLARRIYLDITRAFYIEGIIFPNERERGNALNYIRLFDKLIDSLSASAFDSSLSIVPTGEDGVILDGSHRVATMASLGGKVTVCRFKGVRCSHENYSLFDYAYFMERLMPRDSADLVALEGTEWIKGIKAYCIRPGAACDWKKGATVFYSRTFTVGRKAYRKLCSCLGLDCDLGFSESFPSEVTVVLMIPEKESHESMEGVKKLGNRKDMELFLTHRGRSRWFHGGGIAGAFFDRAGDVLDRVKRPFVFPLRRFFRRIKNLIAR